MPTSSSLAVPPSPRFISALCATSTVTGTAECLGHSLLCPRQDVAARAHGAPDNDRLPYELVVDWDKRVVRGKGTGRPLSVHQQRLQLVAHHVLLHLGINWEGTRGHVYV